MKITKKIEKKIKKIDAGTTFKYQHLSITPEEYSAATKAIERLISKGIIKRISTGVFYKPKQTVFGEINPREEELLKPYLFINGKRIAYITGLSLYNRMGLTTQVPNNIKIACSKKRIYANVGALKGSPTKSYVDVTDNNYQFLEILDALKDFNKIPDLDKESALKVLSGILKKLKQPEIKQIVKCGLEYPPRVRAFLGALLELINISVELISLKKSLNPLSEYKYGFNNNLLPTSRNWNIK